MTVAQRRAEAARLRRKGLKYREIADRLGVATSTAQAYVTDPDGARLKARKAGVPCPRCGGPTDGSRGRARPARLCQTCRNRDGVPMDDRRKLSAAALKRNAAGARSRTVTLEEFAAGVRETADRLGSVSLSRIAYERHRADGLLSHPAVADRWRWKQIIAAAGLTPTRASYDQYVRLTAETAIEAVRDCAADVGRFPPAYIYEAWAVREGRPCVRTVLRALHARAWVGLEEML